MDSAYTIKHPVRRAARVVLALAMLWSALTAPNMALAEDPALAGASGVAELAEAEI